MAENQILERHRMVADAIILERAARVLARRGAGGNVALKVFQAHIAAGSYLRHMAKDLREEAQASDSRR